MGAAYSSLVRTNVLYATSLVLLGAKAKILQKKPSILSEIAIPRYFADWTFSKVWLWRE